MSFGLSFLAVGIGTSSNSVTKYGCLIENKGFKGVPSFGCLAEILINVVQFAYGASLLVAIGIFVFGGFKYMLAQDEKGAKAARDKMTWSVAGFVFIICSFLIIQTVLKLIGLPPELINDFSFFDFGKIAKPVANP